MRRNLFVCDDATPSLLSAIEEAIEDYKIQVRNSSFEICDTNSIPNRSFSYFNEFDKIYVLNDETTKKIKESFDIEDYKFCIIKLNKNADRKRRLSSVLFELMIQNT